MPTSLIHRLGIAFVLLTGMAALAAPVDVYDGFESSELRASS